MAHEHHIVYPYQERDTLGQAVASWLAPALRAGGGALLACRPDHATLVRAALQLEGLDVAALEANGRLAIHDAEVLMARFIVDDVVDGRSFKRLTRSLIGDVRQAGATGAVRIWGEMVDVLAQQGRYDGAARLEDLWNEILAEDDLELLCSYDLDALDPTAHARVLLDVCSTHAQLEIDDGAALDDAVKAALRDRFGDEQANLLVRVLPARHRLLLRMHHGSAILVSLRSIDPAMGAEIHRLARSRLVTQNAPR